MGSVYLLYAKKHPRTFKEENNRMLLEPIKVKHEHGIAWVSVRGIRTKEESSTVVEEVFMPIKKTLTVRGGITMGAVNDFDTTITVFSFVPTSNAIRRYNKAREKDERYDEELGEQCLKEAVMRFTENLDRLYGPKKDAEKFAETVKLIADAADHIVYA